MTLFDQMPLSTSFYSLNGYILLQDQLWFFFSYHFEYCIWNWEAKHNLEENNWSESQNLKANKRREKKQLLHYVKSESIFNQIFFGE